MAISINGKEVTDIVADGNNVSEVYAGSNKVWGKDNNEPVPPYAMMFAVEKYSPLQRAVYAPEPTGVSAQYSGRTAILTTLLGPDGVVELKNGSDVRLKISRNGDSRTVSAWSKSDRDNTGTSTSTASSDMPYIPVAVIIGTRLRGYTVRVWVDGSGGNTAELYSSGLFAPTDVLQSTELVTTNSWGTEWAPDVSASSDWRKSAATAAWATPYFSLAQQHNVSWEHFHGPQREWMYLTAAERDVLGRDYAWKYRNPAETRDHNYSLPDGVTYQEGFFLGGSFQEGLRQGGEGGQGGNSGGESTDGNCYFPNGNWGDCGSGYTGKGRDGVDGGNNYHLWRNAFTYSRTTHILRNPSTINVGRGSQLATPLYWGNEERTGTDAQKGAGGAGGAGGKYVPGDTRLYAGALGTRPPTPTGTITNGLKFSGYTTSDGTKYTRPSTTGNVMRHDPSWDYYTSAGYDDLHDVFPTECDGLEIETKTPKEDETRFNISESWWATNLPIWRAQRPVRFYTHRKGQKFSWPVEPTAGNDQAAYEDILAPGWGWPGTGGEGGAAGPYRGNGYPGKRGGGSWSDAGGPGVVAMYYEFEEPSA